MGVWQKDEYRWDEDHHRYLDLDELRLVLPRYLGAAWTVTGEDTGGGFIVVFVRRDGAEFGVTEYDGDNGAALVCRYDTGEDYDELPIDETVLPGHPEAEEIADAILRMFYGVAS